MLFTAPSTPLSICKSEVTSSRVLEYAERSTTSFSYCSSVRLRRETVSTRLSTSVASLCMYCILIRASSALEMLSSRRGRSKYCSTSALSASRSAFLTFISALIESFLRLASLIPSCSTDTFVRVPRTLAPVDPGSAIR